MLSPILILAATTTAPAGPLRLEIDDPKAIAVVLDCGGRKTQATVVNGVAAFATLGETTCTVHVIRTLGTIDNPGTWACTDATGCTQEEIHHAPVSDAPGTVNVILAGEYVHTLMELTCGAGYRERAPITENTAVFVGVPDADCTLVYKGGPPVTFTPVRWGTYRCELSGTIAGCVMTSRPN